MVRINRANKDYGYDFEAVHRKVQNLSGPTLNVAISESGHILITKINQMKSDFLKFQHIS